MSERIAFLTRQSPSRFWPFTLLGVMLAAGAGYLVGTMGVAGSVLAVLLPVGMLLGVGVLLEPRFGLFLYVQFCFVIGFSRFAQVEIPVGTLVDALLALTLFSTLLNGKEMAWSRLRSPLFVALSLWFIYTVLELFNPEAPYRPAWLYHVRPFSLHWFMVAIIVLVTPIKRSDIRIMVNTWLFWSFLAALWAFKQKYVGLTTAEWAWLNNGNAKTHLLFGRLRCFSFYSDAAQFGAEMAAVTLVSVIRTFEEKTVRRKAFFALLALVYFWGYAVSGTRSALFVLVAGLAFYLLLKRDFLKLTIGAALATPLILLLMYTSIGSSNYEIQRMRSALTPMNDPSFLVRLENQKKLAEYLRDLPFGAGIGTSADTGARFSPHHFAAQIPPDSWYVEIWIETGVVGLTLYIAMLLFLIAVGVKQVWQLRDPWLEKTMLCLLAEFFGIAVMAYSNPVIGQFPTNGILFISTVLFTTCYRWDTRREAEPAVHYHAYRNLSI